MFYFYQDMEVAIFTTADQLADADTYEAKFLKKIRGAIFTSNTNTDSDVNVTFSGSTATFNIASGTHKGTLLLFGDQ